MNLLEQAINDNKLLLQELSHLLKTVSQQQVSVYSKPIALLNNNSIGSHIRHILEHYQIFFSAMKKDIPIDYDHRERCSDCQSKLGKALLIIGQLDNQFVTFSNEDHRVAVSIITNPSLTDMVSKSSVLRELQFLQSHTVHHLSIIGIALRNQGFEVSGHLTKAPSTLQYEYNQ